MGSWIEIGCDKARNLGESERTIFFDVFEDVICYLFDNF